MMAVRAIAALHLLITLTDSDSAAVTQFNRVSGFNSDGFDLDGHITVNGSGYDYVSWTFRKAPGFFDVVTYNGSNSTQTIAHSLGSKPGMIFVKRLDSADSWHLFHEDIPIHDHLRLETNAATNAQDVFNSTEPTSTHFTVIGDNGGVNQLNGQYVAYLFANDDTRFGTNGDESIIKCGTYEGNGGTQEIDLGFEPQWLMIKNIDSASDQYGDADWTVYDMMRGFNAQDSEKLHPNLTSVELSGGRVVPTPTGFKIDNESNIDINASGNTYIYMAIRRPHKPPTAATEVFAAAYQAGATTNTPGYISGFPVDAVIRRDGLSGNTFGTYVLSRLTGTRQMATSSTAAETNNSSMVMDYMNGYNSDAGSNTDVFSLMFKRAPGFMDVVAFEGNGVQGRNIPHNLGVAPDLMIVKNRDTSPRDWHTYVSGITHLSVYGSDPDNYGNNPPRLYLNRTDAAIFSASGSWDHTHPTATTFRVGNETNGNGDGQIAYLFASLGGISKVGSYSGTGSDIDVDCGFSAGARFVLIKRLTFAGSWYVWDTTRGIVSGNDPYILLDTTAAQITDQDNIDPINSGFRVVSNLGALNATGSTYLFLAIA
jgi:hypothetical protein